MGASGAPWRRGAPVRGGSPLSWCEVDKAATVTASAPTAGDGLLAQVLHVVGSIQKNCRVQLRRYGHGLLVKRMATARLFYSSQNKDSVRKVDDGHAFEVPIPTSESMHLRQGRAASHTIYRMHLR